jgi:predicted dienelactone hydrolase
MRLLELALLVTTLLSFIVVIPNIIKNKILLYVMVISITSLSILQLFFEGYRWQLIPTYLFASITILFIFKKLQSQQLRLKWYTTSFMMIWGIISLLLPIVFPVFYIPKPTGEYDVGKKNMHLIDHNREEILTSNKIDKRELMVTISYPISKQQSEKNLNYVEEAEFFIEAIHKKTNIPKFFFRYVDFIKSNGYATNQLAKSDTPFPVLIFSHGYPGARFMYTSIIEEMVSNGYIVISVDHTYHSSMTAFSSTREDSSLEANEVVSALRGMPSRYHISEWDEIITNIWEKDHRFLLDFIELLSKDPQFKGKMDTNKIGVIGHSFGGAAALQTLLDDERVRLAVNLDGSYYGKVVNQSAPKKPLLWMIPKISMETYEEELGISLIEYQKAVKELERRNQIMIEYASDVQQVSNVKHMSFSDYYFYSPYLAISDKINVYQYRTINKIIVDFLNKNFY